MRRTPVKIRKNGLFAGLAAMAALAVGFAALTSTVAASGGKDVAKVGARAPDFTLTDTAGQEHSLASYTGKGQIVVLEWFNAGCPFVVRHHEKYKTMSDLAAKHAGKVTWIAINSGAPGKQGYGIDKEFAKKWNISYPILLDADGSVGRLYGAKTTPHMYIIDTKGVLVYAGGIDNDRGDSKSPSDKVNYVAKALDEVLAGKPVSEAETSPYGCSVKYAD